MKFRYPRHRIQEIVQAEKCLTEGDAIKLDGRLISDGNLNYCER